MARKPKVGELPKKADRPKREKKKEEVEKVSPKKKAVEKSPKKVKKVAGDKKKSHPPYKRMIARAIKDTPEKLVSGYKISKYIHENFAVGESFQRYLKKALKTGVENKELVQIKGSYRLSAKVLHKKDRKKRKKSKPAEKEGEEKRKVKKDKKDKSPEKRKKKDRKAEKESPRKKKRASKEDKAEDAPKAEKRGKAKNARGSAEADEVPSAIKAVGSRFDHVWQYEDNGGIWRNYVIEASDTVEEVYQAYLINRGGSDVRAVKSGDWEYQVDFMAMKQTNIQHPAHTVRNIRRLPIAK